MDDEERSLGGFEVGIGNSSRRSVVTVYVANYGTSYCGNKYRRTPLLIGFAVSPYPHSTFAEL